nr:unnamed protein product [Callosobruchus chinensis]
MKSIKVDTYMVNFIVYNYEQLRELPEKFYSYFRMNISGFDYILDKIEHKLLKKRAKFILTPINSTERLAVT